MLKYVGELGVNFEVYRNDELTVDDIKRYGLFLRSIQLIIFVYILKLHVLKVQVALN